MNAVIDRVVQYPNRFKLTNSDTGDILGTFDLSPETGTVSVVGTILNHDLFQSIADDLADRVKTNGGVVSDTTETFTMAGIRTNITSGETISVSFGKIAKIINDLKAVAFSGNKADIGLGNVDNTSDASKPVSNATEIELNKKVDKVDGSSLMTDAEHNKLSGIADGAEVNVNADWNATSGDAQILNKPNSLSQFTNDPGYISGITTTMVAKLGKLSNATSGNADTATKATQDASGHVITDYYRTISDSYSKSETPLRRYGSILDNSSTAGTTWGKVADITQPPTDAINNISFLVESGLTGHSRIIGILKLSMRNGHVYRFSWLVKTDNADFPLSSFVAIQNGLNVSIYVKTSFQYNGISFSELSENSNAYDAFGSYALYSVINPTITDLSTVAGTKTVSTMDVIENTAAYAENATNATNDDTGNRISTTYLSKSDASSTYVAKSSIDSVPTENSTNPITSGGVYTAIKNGKKIYHVRQEAVARIYDSYLMSQFDDLVIDCQELSIKADKIQLLSADIYNSSSYDYANLIYKSSNFSFTHHTASGENPQDYFQGSLFCKQLVAGTYYVDISFLVEN
jgi:hypothetical protein